MSRHRGDPRLELTHVLVAADLNPVYVEQWPLVRRAWERIAGLEPVLVLVAEQESIPPHLADDPAVRIFEPERSLHTAFQAQCIRLLYPAMLEAQGAVLTADADIVPMNHRYFHEPLRRIGRHHFVCYRDVLLPLSELPICYNAALPQTWGAVFGVRDLADVRSALRAWADGIYYEGSHGGAGWTTDQRQLYRILLERGARRHDVWILNDTYAGYRRLERAYVERWGVPDDTRRRIARGSFSDFHLLRPDGENALLNDEIIGAAIEAAR